MKRRARLLAVFLLLGAASPVLPPGRARAESGATASDIPALVAALSDADPRARESAAAALGRIGPEAEAAVDALVERFADDDLYVRGAAAVALGTIGSASVPALSRALSDPRVEVRESAAITFGRLGPQGRGGIPSLAGALADESDLVRYEAVVALGGLRSAAREAVPALTEALHDREKSVRGAAALALERIAPGARSGRPDRGALVATIDRLVPMLMVEHRVPGVSIALIQDGQVSWSKAYGVRDASTREPATTDTVFEAASMSKPVFAMLVVRLVDSRRLELDRPLVQYHREVMVPDQPARERVTSRMVLSHTSGYPNWRPGGEEREGALQLLFEPGSRFGYSGEGYFCLQRVVEDLTSRPLDRLAIEELFRPLGLARTSYAWNPEIGPSLATGHGDDGSVRTRSKYTHPNAAYTLYTTAPEYARLLVEMMRAGNGSSTLISKKSAKRMLERQVQLDSRDAIERPGLARGRSVYWGLGFSINDTWQGAIAHHSGSNRTGFTCFSQFSPTRGSGLVIMTNGSQGGELWARLVAAIGDL